MATAPFTLHCADVRCKAPNSSQDEVCKRCGSPLIRRYLWVVGEGLLPVNPEQAQGHDGLIQERYRWVNDPSDPQLGRIVLDTRPGEIPEMPPPKRLPAALIPYLRLFPYRFSLPQVYGLLRASEGKWLFLLENGPIYPQHGQALEPNGSFRSAEGQLMPTLAEAWPRATPQRQLGWLWQLVRLWEPLAQQGVTATLLQADLIRVEGSTVRLLALESSLEPPSLAQLAPVWQSLAATAHPSIAPFLSSVLDRLTSGAIAQVEHLTLILDRALALACEGQTVEIRVATCTDQGPQRSQNEDACLPKGGTFRITRPGHQALTLVCDGLGGHDGGEVASQWAADYIHRYLQTPTNLEGTTPGIAMQRSICQANERLLQRNNAEKRSSRQRMGTTVVMAWMVKHLTYLGHVGDSRIYRITPSGYSQLTVDDNVASQAVSLGQDIYRQALRPTMAGALTQALGITDTQHLRPTIQRFFFDDEMVLLLCSDGVSDRDRIPEVWGRILLPIFSGKTNVAVLATELLKSSNQLNGHDNSTIALVHCQVKDQPLPNEKALLALLETSPSANLKASQPQAHEKSGQLSRVSRDERPFLKLFQDRQQFSWTLLAWFLVGLGTLGVAFGLGYRWFNPALPNSEAAELDRR